MSRAKTGLPKNRVVRRLYKLIEQRGIDKDEAYAEMKKHGFLVGFESVLRWLRSEDEPTKLSEQHLRETLDRMGA